MTMTTTDDITEGCQTRENSVIEPNDQNSSRRITLSLMQFLTFRGGNKVYN